MIKLNLIILKEWHVLLLLSLTQKLLPSTIKQKILSTDVDKQVIRNTRKTKTFQKHRTKSIMNTICGM